MTQQEKYLKKKNDMITYESYTCIMHYIHLSFGK